MSTTATDGAPASETERAERIVEDAEHRAEDWGERVGDWAARLVARAREEAEDIWAEAQAVRRRL